MPKPYPREFRDDVVRVARNRDGGVTLEQTHPTSSTPPEGTIMPLHSLVAAVSRSPVGAEYSVVPRHQFR